MDYLVGAAFSAVPLLVMHFTWASGALRHIAALKEANRRLLKASLIGRQLGEWLSKEAYNCSKEINEIDAAIAQSEVKP